MYPPSPYAVPVGSFQTPVALPTTDPLEGPFFYVGINCEWMPLIVGALKQLLLQATWATNDVNALQKVQGQVFNLIAQFNCATAPSLSDLCGLPGGSCEECEMCCLRFQNGVLQQLVCGTWTDVPGQPTGGFQGPSQPGAGSPQPPPDGGCKQYHAQLLGNGRWLAPTVVSTGDTIQVTGENGVTYNNVTLDWYCPDGSVFFAGVCTGITQLDGADPLPSVPHQKLIALIGSTYYDVGFSTFTVPSGHDNDPVTFQVNDDTLTDDAGSLSFDVEICNNQAGSFSHVFDFTKSPQGWQPTNDGGGERAVWESGQGFGANPSYKPGRITVDAPAGSGSATIDQIEVSLTGPLTGPAPQVAASCGAFSAALNITGPNFFFSGINTTVGAIEVDIAEDAANPNTPVVDVILERIIISGTGIDPWV